MNKKLQDELEIMDNIDIEQNTDIKNALEMINQENIVSTPTPLNIREFVVQKKGSIQLSKNDMIIKNEEELNEIADQADQAFIELMTIALNANDKSCGDIASAANNFLNIKLNSRLAKIESRLKREQLELNKKKFEASLQKYDAPEKIEENDGIIIIEND